MRIIIVADNASRQFGGEAFIPLNYFRLLLARNEDVRLVVHARNKSELTQQFPDHLDRLYFVDDTAMHKALFRFSRFLPRRLADATTGLIIHLSTQLSQRRVVRDLIKLHQIEVVHQPIPVSPKTPSLMWGLGAAVVIGPLNGGMDYPEAFRRERSILSRLAFTFGRWLANFVNDLLPGKRRANVILVANQRTRGALPRGISGHVVELVENGVDFAIWRQGSVRKQQSDLIDFIFVGRLIDLKALDIVFEAIGRLMAIPYFAGDNWRRPDARKLASSRQSDGLEPCCKILWMAFSRSVRDEIAGGGRFRLAKSARMRRRGRSGSDGNGLTGHCDGLGRTHRLSRQLLWNIGKSRICGNLIAGFSDAMARLATSQDLRSVWASRLCASAGAL